MKKNNLKKLVWKVFYVLLILGCLGCIIGMVRSYQKNETEGILAEEQRTELEQSYVVIPEEEDLEVHQKAELPMDFEGLKQVNPEIYAWIRIPDTNIDYPILQHEDIDQSYYLTRNLYGKEASAGSIYTENYNSRDFTDPNTIIYGHNMKNGSMFHNLRYFAQESYFTEHEELLIYLPDKILQYRIVACYEYDDRHLLTCFDFEDSKVFANYLEDILNPRSIYANVRQGITLSSEDRLITLSTCIAGQPDSRRLLQAVLISETEAEYKGAENEKR